MRHSLLPIVFLLLAPLPAQAIYMVGDTVADFALLDLDGQAVALSDFAGKVVLLNFFRTDCPGCDEEAASLQADIWEVYQDQGVIVLAVSIEQPQPLVQGWAASNEVNYHIWLAPDWEIYNLFFSSYYVPYNTVLDRRLILRYSQTGYDRDTLIDTIETILGEPTPVSSRGTWGGVKGLYR